MEKPMPEHFFCFFHIQKTAGSNSCTPVFCPLTPPGGTGNPAAGYASLDTAAITGSGIASSITVVFIFNRRKLFIKINFKQSDILKNIQGKFDIIISNPPYIAKDEKIDPLVKNNEPHIALYADNNGLYFYEEILKNIKPHLKEKSIIAFEIGMTQSEEVTKIANKYLPKAKIITEKDLAQKNRYIFIFV